MSDPAADYRRELAQRGFTVTKAKRNGHYKVYDGSRLIAVQCATASDGRALKNFRAQVARYLRQKN